MDLYFQKGTNLTVDPPLGYSLIENSGDVVAQSIVIQPEKPYLYHNKRFLNALNSGSISQSLYDEIIDNQSEGRQVWEISSDIDVDKNTVLSLVENYGISNVEEDGTISEIIEDIINEGYQIIKKI